MIALNKKVSDELIKIAETKEGYRRSATERSASIVAQLDRSVAEMTDAELLAIKYIGNGTVEKIRNILKSDLSESEVKVEEVPIGRFLRDDIKPLVKVLSQYLDDLGIQYIFCGSWRRGLPTIKDLDIIIIDDSIDRAVQFPYIEKVLWSGSQKVSVIDKLIGIQIDFRLATRKTLGSMMLYFTGSKEFNIEMRKFSKSKGFRLNEYGIFKDNELVASETEESIFETLGIDHVKPEDRR